MAMMCDECKCSAYWNEELNQYACENGCACCNDPDYESDWDTHLRILKQIKEYIQLHELSLTQDSEKVWQAMDQIDDLESDEYEQLNIQDISLNGQIFATRHILHYIYELDKVSYEGVK